MKWEDALYASIVWVPVWQLIVIFEIKASYMDGIKLKLGNLVSRNIKYIKLGNLELLV